MGPGRSWEKVASRRRLSGSLGATVKPASNVIGIYNISSEAVVKCYTSDCVLPSDVPEGPKARHVLSYSKAETYLSERRFQLLTAVCQTPETESLEP
jgi:hypothetical protein